MARRVGLHPVEKTQALLSRFFKGGAAVRIGYVKRRLLKIVHLDHVDQRDVGKLRGHAVNAGVNDAERALIQGDAADSAKPPPLSWRAMLKSPTLWCLCLMYFCSNAGWCFFITWDVQYYKTVLGLEGWALTIASGYVASLARSHYAARRLRNGDHELQGGGYRN